MSAITGLNLETRRYHGFNPMTIIDDSLTRRSETCAFDAVALDVAADQPGPVMAERGAEPLGIPVRFKILCEIGNGGMGIV